MQIVLKTKKKFQIFKTRINFTLNFTFKDNQKLFFKWQI